MGNCLTDSKFLYNLNKKEQNYIKTMTGKFIHSIPLSDIYNERNLIPAGFISDGIYIVKDSDGCYLMINGVVEEIPDKLHLFKNFQVSGDIFASNNTIVKVSEKKMIVKNQSGTFKGLVCGIDSIDEYI